MRTGVGNCLPPPFQNFWIRHWRVEFNVPPDTGGGPNKLENQFATFGSNFCPSLAVIVVVVAPLAVSDARGGATLPLTRWARFIK